MADHKHGEMDIQVQEKTFEGFIKVTVWSCVAIFIALVFLARAHICSGYGRIREDFKLK